MTQPSFPSNPLEYLIQSDYVQVNPDEFIASTPLQEYSRDSFVGNVSSHYINRSTIQDQFQNVINVMETEIFQPYLQNMIRQQGTLTDNSNTVQENPEINSDLMWNDTMTSFRDYSNNYNRYLSMQYIIYHLRNHNIYSISNDHTGVIPSFLTTLLDDQSQSNESSTTNNNNNIASNGIQTRNLVSLRLNQSLIRQHYRLLLDWLLLSCIYSRSPNSQAILPYRLRTNDDFYYNISRGHTIRDIRLFKINSITQTHIFEGLSISEIVNREITLIKSIKCQSIFGESEDNHSKSSSKQEYLLEYSGKGDENIESIINDSKRSCPICFADFFDGEVLRSINKCGHRFHDNCLDSWLYMKSTCPICRYDLSEAIFNLDLDPLSILRISINNTSGIRNTRSPNLNLPLTNIDLNQEIVTDSDPIDDNNVSLNQEGLTSTSSSSSSSSLPLTNSVNVSDLSPLPSESISPPVQVPHSNFNSIVLNPSDTHISSNELSPDCQQGTYCAKRSIDTLFPCFSEASNIESNHNPLYTTLNESSELSPLPFNTSSTLDNHSRKTSAENVINLENTNHIDKSETHSFSTFTSKKSFIRKIYKNLSSYKTNRILTKIKKNKK